MRKDKKTTDLYPMSFLTIVNKEGDRPIVFNIVNTHISNWCSYFLTVYVGEIQAKEQGLSILYSVQAYNPKI
jgi:hypothetical protein